jgi:hypothetical protein
MTSGRCWNNRRSGNAQPAVAVSAGPAGEVIASGTGSSRRVAPHAWAPWPASRSGPVVDLYRRGPARLGGGMNTFGPLRGPDPGDGFAVADPMGCAAQRTGLHLPPQGSLRDRLRRRPPAALDPRASAALRAAQAAGQRPARADARHTHTTSVQLDRSLHGFRGLTPTRVRALVSCGGLELPLDTLLQ